MVTWKLENKIDLRSGCSPVEIGDGARRSGTNQCFDHMPFPTCTSNRMTEEVVDAVDAQECVDQSAVPDVDLGRLDQTVRSNIVVI